MSFVEIVLIAIGLAADAFAVSVCIGLATPKDDRSGLPHSLKRALIVGAYFGAFQAGMPLLGYAFASLFAGGVLAYGHWVAFALLIFLGGKMVLGSLKKEDGTELTQSGTLSPSRMLPLAVATSIDAMAIGASFAFLQVGIVFSVLLIGVVTLIFSVVGVALGRLFGDRFKSKAEFAGGVILILIGIKIFVDHIVFTSVV